MTYPKTKKIMNEIVADLTQTHMLVHQHHWYMLGRGFLKLHPYLDEVMDELAEQQDGVAERLIEINGSPISTYEEVLEETNVPDQLGSWDLSIEERFQLIVNAYKQLREDEGDDSTNDLLIAYHTAVEKRIWMMSAELGQRPGEGE